MRTNEESLQWQVPAFEPVNAIPERGRLVHADIVRTHLGWMRANRPVADFNRLLEGLSPAMRRALRRPFGNDLWFPFAWVVRLEQAIAAICGDAGAPERLGAHLARLEMREVARSLNVAAVAERAAAAFSLMQRMGGAVVRRNGDDLEVAHEGWVASSPLFCRMAAGFYGESIALSPRAGGATASEVECQAAGAPRCAFALRLQ